MTTKLTMKQRAFADNKAAGMTNRDAVVAAGYAVAAAGPTAYKLMQHPGVRNAIKAATNGTPSVDTKSGMPKMPREKYDDPMVLLVDIMGLEGLPLAMRADAAKQLLPYMHARMGEQGKKEKTKDRAHKIASSARGRLQPMPPPTMRVIPGGKGT